MNFPKFQNIVAIAFYGCLPERLEVGTHPQGLDAAAALHAARWRQVAEAAGFTCYGSYAVKFSNDPAHGFTGAVPVGFSQIEFHSWPEVGTAVAVVDTCSEEDACGEAIEKFKKLMTEYLEATSTWSSPMGFIPLRDPDSPDMRRLIQEMKKAA